jgi:hypothetical protein
MPKLEYDYRLKMSNLINRQIPRNSKPLTKGFCTIREKPARKRLLAINSRSTTTPANTDSRMILII